MIAFLAAAALAASPAPLIPGLAANRSAPHLEESWEDASHPSHGEDAEEEHTRLRIVAWGGEGLAGGGAGRSSPFAGGEAAWVLSSLDLGLAGFGYRNLADATRTWTPVVLARITQRFETQRGFEAALGFGLGAGKPRGWTAWYQLALGVRVPVGRLFFAGELAFEQYDLLRLGAGVGVAL